MVPEESLLPGEAAEYHIRMPADIRWRDKDNFSVFVHKDANVAAPQEVEEPTKFGETEVTLPDELNKVRGACTFLHSSQLGVNEMESDGVDWVSPLEMSCGTCSMAD